MKIPLYNIPYSNPYVSFLVYSIIIALAIAFAFLVNEYIDTKIKYKTQNERYRIRFFSHLIVALIFTFFVITLFFLLFGWGQSFYPVCTFVDHCKDRFKEIK